MAKKRDFRRIFKISHLQRFFLPIPSIFNFYKRTSQVSSDSKTRLLTYHTTKFKKFHFWTLLQVLLNFEADVRTVPDTQKKKIKLSLQSGSHIEQLNGGTSLIFDFYSKLGNPIIYPKAIFSSWMISQKIIPRLFSIDQILALFLLSQ